MKLVKVKADRNGADSVAERKRTFGVDRDMQFLEQCAVLWENLRPMRRNRARANRFTYGDQWGDRIRVNGKDMFEREYVAKQGNVALQTNQIKKIVTTVTGAWVKEKNEPVCTARDRNEQAYGEVISATVQANWQKNKNNVIMSICLEEALEGGLCVAKESYESRNFDREDAYTDYINPNNIFFDSGMKDPRFWDMSLIGEIHDVDYTEVLKFADSPEDVAKIKEWYLDESSPLKFNDSIDATDKNNEKYMDFYTPHDSKKCRVFEIWTKERRPRYRVWDKNEGSLYAIDVDDKKAIAEIKRINEERRASAPADWSEEELPLIELHYFIDTFWYVRFMTPRGYILFESESIAADRSHPYTLLAVPFTNGLIVSYINDAIDQNKAINRILTLDDWIRRSGAKGVTFVPQNIIPDDMDYKTFAEQWTSIDGIVYYKPNKTGEVPKTFYGNVGTLNTAELVKMMSDLMESSTSVSGAIQGKTPYAGTSAALYAQQTQNSTTPMAPLLEKFNMFVEAVAIKKCQLICQHYTPDRYMEIAGSLDFDPATLNLDKMGDVQTDLAIKQSTETPANRMLINDWLMQLLQVGAISGEDAIAVGSFPGADKLLERLQARQQELAAMQGAAPQVGADYEQKQQTIRAAQS